VDMIVIWIGLGIIFLWIGWLTYSFFSLKNHYNMLISNGNKKTLEGVLTSMTKELSLAKADIAQLLKRCDTIEMNELLHIQKIGLVRFNPFKDTGGDQSFILSLVDAQNTGVVITALYSRSGTRWYAKRVIEGKGAEHELSEEEKKALKLASRK
jgi:hypothetical protein